MTKPKVFLTRRWPIEAELTLSKSFNVTLNKSDLPLSRDQIAKGFSTHDALAPTVSDKIDSYIIESGANGKGKIISNFGVGINHIDLKTCKNFHIPVTNTPGVLTDATADLTLLLMLMISRRAGEGERELRSGLWSGWTPTHLMGSQMSNKVLGIVGMGRIGQAVAKRASLGFNMKVFFYNRSKIESNFSFNCRQIDSLMELCKKSDFISLHCPGDKSTKHIINSEMISYMKKSAFIINSSRGDVLDENAVANALEKGSISGAGLDVFNGEPIINPNLLKAPNTVFLPHLGSATLETRTAMGLKVSENLEAFFKKDKPPDLV